MPHHLLQPEIESRERREAARSLVLREGWNSTCYQILNPGIRLWFSRDGDACMGYVRRGRTLVVAGAPVCALERLPEVMAEWEGEGARRRLHVCYFGAERRLRDYVANRQGYATVVLGAQPEWSPEEFVRRLIADRSLRAQLYRARNKAVTVEEWPCQRAENSPELRHILTDWLDHKGLPPLHFLVEPETLGDMRDRRMFVATRHGKPIAFVTLCPVPARDGWLTEQFVYLSDAPNGKIELALYHAIDAVRREGARFVTMGVVPLSPHGDIADEPNPGWLQTCARWVREHGRRLYNFNGLDSFKSKFHPETWEPVVAISKEPGFSVRTLRAIASAFALSTPERTVAAGLLKALKADLSRLGRG